MMNLRKEEKAQGSLEYLLILAGAIIIAVAVGLYLKSIPQAVQHKFHSGTEHIIHGF